VYNVAFALATISLNFLNLFAETAKKAILCKDNTSTMTMTNTSKGHLTTTAGGTAKSTTCILILSLFLSSIFSTNFPRYVSAGSINSVKVKLRNESGEKLAVNWVNPNTQAAVLMNYVEPNRTYIVNSYVSHRFQILQVPDDDSGACGGGDGVRDEQEQQDGTCKVGYFQITQLEPEQGELQPSTSLSHRNNYKVVLIIAFLCCYCGFAPFSVCGKEGSTD
jgi:hypothetical protein